ncbi:MAG: P-II family nitrogen regulator [Aeriscardovia sp.]|nr:P-II family nitrogen regulator [Aeriscardovia sp.]MBR2673815.1 P-II family nitrogen regulator [Aeriscardovia sp.]
MKLVTAIIRTSRLDQVKAALATVGVQGFTVTQAGGFGEQQGHAEIYRGARYNVDFLSRLHVDVIASDEDAATIQQAIVAAACTGSIGDGITWIMPLDSVMHIRDGKEGAASL